MAINVGKHVCRQMRGSLIENNNPLHEKQLGTMEANLEIVIQIYVMKIINKHPVLIDGVRLTNLRPENFA